MNDIITDLVRRAIDDHDAIGLVLHPEHITFERVCMTCTRAIDQAIDDRIVEAGEHGILETYLLYSNHAEIAYKQLLEHAWDRRGARDQLDMFQQEPIWRGNAAHEARKDLE